jgi:hypothetical protein
LGQLSAGIQFGHTQDIENVQIVRAALAWIQQQPFVFDRATTSAFLNDPHAWMPASPIPSTERWSQGDVAVVRAVRDDEQDLVDIFADFRSEQLTPEDRFLRSVRAYGPIRLKMWREREQRIRAGVDPNDEKRSAYCPVWRVIMAFQQLGLELETVRDRTGEFFTSDALLSVPALRLRSMLMATWAREEQTSTKPPDRSDRGTLTDFTAISTSLPFCNAMFVDHRCAEYLRQQPLAGEVAKYECEIFSVRTGEQFLSYLRELEEAVPEQQRMLVEDIYGPLPSEVSQILVRV